MVNRLDVHSFIYWNLLNFWSFQTKGRLARIGQDVKQNGQFKLIKLGWVVLKRIYILPLPGVIDYKVKFNQV